MKIRILAAAAALVFSGVAAHATTITVTEFDASAYKSIVSGFNSSVSEDFEGFDVGTVADPFKDTAVGRFNVIGDGVGSGGTVSDAGFPNDGTTLAIRDGNVFGRTSTTSALTGDAADDQFLDSNDTFGIRYKADLGGELFDKIVLTLTDSAEFGNRMIINAGGGVKEFITNGNNGESKTVVVDLGGFVDTAVIRFLHKDGKDLTVNDGFSIDDVTLSTVPLPASGLLLIAGFGGLMAMRRRKTA